MASFTHIYYIYPLTTTSVWMEVTHQGIHWKINSLLNLVWDSDNCLRMWSSTFLQVRWEVLIAFADRDDAKVHTNIWWVLLKCGQNVSSNLEINGVTIKETWCGMEKRIVVTQISDETGLKENQLHNSQCQNVVMMRHFTA